jgi:hypothetical protein
LPRGRFSPGLLAWCSLLAAPTAAAAQLSGTLDAGWATVRYDEYLRSTVTTLSPGLRLEYPRSTVLARGTLSLFESGSRSFDVALAASTFSAARGAFRLEASGGTGGTLYNGLGTGYLTAGLRLHALGSRAGAWVGGSGGYVDDGILGFTTGRYSAGAWTRFGGFSVSTLATHLRAAPISVTDVEAGLLYARGGLHVAAGAGRRFGGDGVIGARTWGELSANLWLSRHFALVGAHGRYPPEPARGTPGGSYSTIALRLATRPPARNVLLQRGHTGRAPSFARPNVQQLLVRKVEDSTYLITVRAPGATRVEVAGDFTEWTPRFLSREADGDSYTIAVQLSPGAHKFNLRVDGGEWGIPPGVPVLRDEQIWFVAHLIIE